MLAELSAWIGDLHHVLPAPVVGAVVTFCATLCGAGVGFERGRREKPAGLRSMMLVCLGACIFTQVGILMAGTATDTSRVAANVVTGVGFLGAGAIIRDRGQVIGFTTGAAIWTVAAIGVMIGAGYVAAGLFLTALAISTLAAERRLEQWLYGACRFEQVQIDFDPVDGRTRVLMQGILDEHAVPESAAGFEEPAAGLHRLTVRCCHRHRNHRAFLPEVAATPGVRAVRRGPVPTGGSE